ncbi:hypothetical protein [Spirosoma utsteinense]|uniref:Natural product n=1 Tax=Spirosoma utsteinense TaxID=2585773 RepID=A0ABR6WEG8_9BACT|nr:hypothetical protein [Spirosoma utsteinense]MBC3794945.1 hypothetical protein [Spirosoma utsteinense]
MKNVKSSKTEFIAALLKAKEAEMNTGGTVKTKPCCGGHCQVGL